MFRALKRIHRFVKESLRFAHRSVPRHPEPGDPDRNVVRSFVAKRWKPPTRKSEAIFADLMGSTSTRHERLTSGVEEHPHFGSWQWGTPGASAKRGSYAVFHWSIHGSRVGRDL